MKKIEDMSKIELQIRDVFEAVERLENKLQKMEAMTDSILIKAQLSYSLLVVRKVSEDKIEKLDMILD